MNDFWLIVFATLASFFAGFVDAVIGGGGTHIRLIADTTLFNDTSTLNLQYTLI